MSATSPRLAPTKTEGWEQLIELRLQSKANRLKIVRECLLPAARLCGFDDTTAHDIQLAVDEALQNAIVHAYGGDGDKELIVTVLRVPQGIAVRIRDFAAPINPADVRPRQLDQVRPGGLGTHFIREIMDSAEFLAIDEPVGNLLQMVKRMEASHERDSE